MFFEGLAGCMRERKGYLKHIKNEVEIYSKMHDKSMQNPCSKKWHKKLHKTSEMEPKGNRNPLQIEKNMVPKTMQKKNCMPGGVGGRRF